MVNIHGLRLGEVVEEIGVSDRMNRSHIIIVLERYEPGQDEVLAPSDGRVVVFSL
jgi:hypothetical protein